ncbi:hypothetical protein EJ073_09605 [Mesorhizobium sp. M4B.F.Ca.ET.058.02.1.1]|nr:hypothetical protein EJ073_09605 [Mesorhizobium sp. M4B.F.Ca.ET.058.02.1.1]
MSQLDMLKQRARVMGIQFSNNIGLDALKAKIQAKLDGEAESQEEAPAEPAVSAATGPKIKSHRQQMRDEYMRLIRVRITNLDPKKKDLPGEIFTFANEVLGAVRKYIPYGEVTDNGYHIPYCIFLQLEDRKFLNIKVRKDNRGREIVESNWVREFALEVLPPLTEVELARLAASQAAAGGVE